MRNLRYLLNNKRDANQLAEDLQVQLEVNRFENVTVVPIPERKELIIQVPEADGALEDTVEAFMSDYKDGLILE
ncbi:hypothetical protein [Ectobacillus ponti]|uniref:Uncharacterized protein n=1 Tax=Ectobacillus ponti TaxID=2961894 RepID=A0AA41XAM2_9BACI|nr:hypothetical protein [Ectobacillus ponti]MCP8969980.1 hypothetical protein [Ectobacillus ponti]